MTPPQRHIPVLLERTVELLEPALQRPGAVLVDATLGLGGHAEAFLERNPQLRVIGLDRDTEALRLAGERLARFGDRVELVHCVYDAIAEAVRGLGVPAVEAILFDLGVSSMQLDETDRGFSYSQDAPLDMRMDPTAALTAERILAEYPEEELRRIFWAYGEERLAPRYARRIAQARASAPITRSGELVRIIAAATPAALARTGHPAKRVFQALRIEVNQELAVLERAIPSALDLLAVHGRIVVLAYQSLEDRIVKRELARVSRSSGPLDLPVELPEHRAQFSLLVRGAERASADEVQSNPRANPVRLRAAERVRSAA